MPSLGSRGYDIHLHRQIVSDYHPLFLNGFLKYRIKIFLDSEVYANSIIRHEVLHVFQCIQNNNKRYLKMGFHKQGLEV